MDVTNLVYWLNGYLEDRDSLTQKEVQRVKDMMASVITVPPIKPSEEEIERMVKSLFPDKTGADLEEAIKHYRNG
jgi:hypothetical protein